MNVDRTKEVSLNRISETIINANNQLGTLTVYLKNELEKYKARPGAHPLYIDTKAKQIKIIEDASESFYTVLDSVVALSECFKQKECQLNDKVFKLEGCLLIHGLSQFEIEKFYRLSVNAVVSEVKAAYAEGWRQAPFLLQSAFISN